MNRIRKRRRDLGMTQEELARKVGYTHRSMIAHIENGDVDLPQSKAKALAKALNTTAIYLLGLEDEIPVYLEQKGESYGTISSNAR